MPAYIHHVPGRLRVRTAAVKRNEAKAEAVRRLLEAFDGVLSVKVNPMTGSVTAHYDPLRTTDAAILELLRGDGCMPSPAEIDPAPAREPPRTAATGFGRTVGETALRFFVEKALERVATAAVAAII